MNSSSVRLIVARQEPLGDLDPSGFWRENGNQAASAQDVIAPSFKAITEMRCR